MLVYIFVSSAFIEIIPKKIFISNCSKRINPRTHLLNQYLHSAFEVNFNKYMKWKIGVCVLAWHVTNHYNVSNLKIEHCDILEKGEGNPSKVIPNNANKWAGEDEDDVLVSSIRIII